MAKIRGKDVAGGIVSVAIAEITGFLSSLLSGDARPQYEQYNQPPLSPPGWVFGVVWPILYALMGIAAYLVYRSDGDRALRRRALILYAIQLLFNFSWSIVFFGSGMIAGAIIVILILDILVIWTTREFYRIDPTAGLLMLPYIAWILFATYLNIMIALMN